MYSNSNAFLGGNHQRHGGQQFGGGFNNMTSGQQQQQQPGPFAPQPTGFAQQPLQQQYTGYPMQAQPTGMPQQPQALQQQYTGYVAPNQIQPGFQPGNAPPVPSIPSQFQQQFQQQQPQTLQSAQQGTLQPQNQQSSGQTQSPALMKPQPTGFTAMAASFQTGGGGATLPATWTGKVNRIPNVRLSFITASDQAKFETLFKSAIGDASTMSGDKARDLLLRSKLDGDSLSQIWSLSDTTRAGELYFPEFALAMYLCNLKLSGKTLPPSLPDNIKNEVSSIVDIIGFSVAEEAASTPAAASTTNAPDFLSANSSAPNQQPQQASNAALLQSQMTGFPGQGAFGNQQQGVQAHQTGFPGLQNPQPTAYQGPRPPMPPMPTGYGQSMQSATPLNAQPTGIPGQWGLVNAPSSGLPNIDALQARMMPQQGREGGSFTTQGLQGNAVIPWAITKEEKTRYDSLFKAWDGFGKGYILGSQAIEIFGQSGLEKPDLERIWTLCDNGNKGRLDLDEFAVAMHLIYRKLNGYPIPNTLPSELVPPSTRNFNQSIGALKSMLHEESDIRKNSGAALLPQKTGVSYMKNRSFRGGAGTSGASRKDATVFRNDDESFGYRSSARRRVGNTSPRSASPSSVDTNDDLSIEQLRKKIREKQVLLDAMDFQDEKNLEEDDILDRRDRRESEELYRRIRRIQDDIDAHPDAALASGDSDAEKRALRRQLQNLLDKVPELASQVRKTEKAIMDARLELFRIKDGKAHPSSTNSIVGTGPGGTVTESDRLKARAKAMMQQRTAALTGRKVDIPLDDDSGVKRLEQETITVKSDKESNERMVRDVEDSVRDFARGIEDSLKEGAKDQSSEHEKRRWEDGLGVEDEVRDFIFDLQRESRSNRLRTQDRRAPTTAKPAAEALRRENTASPRLDSPASTSRTATPPATSGSYAAYKTPEERAAFIRQQAEQRMAERLAALGIKTPSKPGETPSQRSEREKAEKAEKLRQAEQEDARREAQRQARLAEEQGVPPPVDTSTKNDSKKPPPPPSRHENRADTTAQEGVKKVEEEKLAREHEEQHKETQAMEETIKEEEDEFEKEQQAAGARLRALEEQVKQGKLKKEEEKRKKKLAMADAKERENKLAARRGEIEAAKQRELELQRQLEAMNDDTSSEDDEPPQQIVRRQEPETMVSADQPNLKAGNDASSQATNPVTSPTVVAPVPLESESRNPYKKLMSTPASNEATKAAPTVPSATQLPQIEVSTNPFHQMTQAMPQPVSRRRAGSEDWGSDKDEDDEQSDDERPGGGNAAQLASILFGTMAPPRPLSAAGKESAPASPAPAADTGPTSPPPPPPPMPGSTASEVEVSSNALPQIDTTPSPIPVLPVPSSPVTEGEALTAPPPPPPPPPMPSTGAPPPPPPPMPSTGAPPPPPPPPAPAASNGPAPIAGGAGRPSGFLNEIQLGKSLKKTTTKDKSTASVAGRVLE